MLSENKKIIIKISDRIHQGNHEIVTSSEKCIMIIMQLQITPSNSKQAF